MLFLVCLFVWLLFLGGFFVLFLCCLCVCFCFVRFLFFCFDFVVGLGLLAFAGMI